MDELSTQDRPSFPPPPVWGWGQKGGQLEPPLPPSPLTRGEMGGVTGVSQLTGLQSPPPSNSSTTQVAAGPTPSRLLSLFEECVEYGVWARLETYRKRGAVLIGFNCELEVVPTSAAAATPAKGISR